jgi:hypothetical protein
MEPPRAPHYNDRTNHHRIRGEADMSIEKAKETLRDSGAGWVNRRDAVVELAETAGRAMGVLAEFADDQDTDVRMAVTRALDDLKKSAAPPVDSKSYPSLSDMAHSLEKRGTRTVTQQGERFAVETQLDSGRKQTVYLQPYQRRDGAKLLRVFTYCGAPTEDAYPWALRANMKLTQSALALHKLDGEEIFVVTRTFLDGEASPRELKATVKEIAFYGDYIEKRLTGLDDF